MLKIINIIIYIIIIYIIINQFLKLSYFSSNYIYYTDYGNKLNTICNKETVEYETKRFQINKNLKKLNNINVNELYIIVLCSIIFTGMISFIFSLLIYKIFCNMDKSFGDYKIMNKIYIITIFAICIIAFVYPFIYIYLKLVNNYDISLFDIRGDINNMLPFIVTITLLILLKIFTIYYQYKLPEFDKDKKQDYIELIYFIFYSFIYISTIYYITNILYINTYEKKNIKIDYHDYNDKKNIMLQYIERITGSKEHNKMLNKYEYNKLNIDKENIYYDKTLPKDLNNFNIIPIEYIEKIKDDIKKNFSDLQDNDEIDKIIIDIIKTYIKLVYKDTLVKDITREKEYEEKLYEKFEELKKDIDTEIDKYFVSITIQKVVNLIDELASKIIVNNNNSEKMDVDKYEKVIVDIKNSIFRRNISGLIFIIIIFIIILIIIKYLLDRYGFKDYGSKIKNQVTVPLILLFIIIFIINSTNEYNYLLNEYIINKPNIVYKNNLDILSKYLNNLLNNEYNIYINSNNNICKNIKTAVCSIIINNLYNINFNTEIINKIRDFPDSLKEYQDTCNNDEAIIDYDFESYHDDIFYNNEDCSNLNEGNIENIKKLIKNITVIRLDSYSLNELLKEIKDKKFVNLTYEILNLIESKYEFNDVKISLEKIKVKLTNLLNNAIHNVTIFKKTYNNIDTGDKTFIDYLTPQTFNVMKDENRNIDLNKYKFMVENIVDIYIDFYVFNLYNLSNLIENDETINIIIGEDIDIDYNFKKRIFNYIDNFIISYKTFMNDLEKIFRNKYKIDNKSNKLSLYIINIFNNINKEKYIADIIKPVFNNEDKLYNLNESLDDIIKNYNNLDIICNNSDLDDCDTGNNGNTDEYIKNKLIINTNKNIKNINHLSEELIKIETDNDYKVKINTIIDNSNDINYEYDSLQHLIESLKNVVLDVDDNTLLSIYNNILRDIENMETESIKTIKDYILNKLYKYKDKIDNLKKINENINILINKLNNNDKIIEKKDVKNINKNIKDVNLSIFVLIFVYIVVIVLINYIK